MDKEGFALYEHRIGAAELSHRLAELRLCGAFQIQSEHRKIIASQNLFQNFVMLFTFGSGKQLQRFAWVTFSIDEF